MLRVVGTAGTSYWTSTDALNWAPFPADLGTNQVDDAIFYGDPKYIETPWGTTRPSSLGEYAFTPAGRADAVVVPGPPWVAPNRYRGLEGSYGATEKFLIAGDPGETWTGIPVDW